jgi:glycosyltransferase involved in cell wall biosynthesis
MGLLNTLSSENVGLIQNPTVSVLMITYNHQKYVAKALEGILMQVCDFSYEIVIGEDCSKDETASILKDYRAKYPDKIRLLLHHQNIGMVQNINETFNACRGKFIAICEGDDYWIDPNKLQKQVNLLEQYPEASMSVALIKTLTNDHLEEAELPFVSETLPLVYQKGLNKYFHTSTYMIRRTNADKVLKKYRRLFFNDTAICFLLIHTGPFVVLNEVVSVYRQTNEGVWTGASQLHKDLQHYQLHRAFRKHHVRKRFSFHLKWEKKFLDKIMLEDTNYRQQFRFRKYAVDTLFYAIKAYHKLLKLFRA